MPERCPTESEWYALLDGELGPARRESLQEHLGRCRECRDVHDRGRRLATMLATWESVAVPPSLTARLLETARRCELPPRGVATGWQWLTVFFLAGGLAVFARLMQDPAPGAQAWGLLRGMAVGALRGAAFALWSGLRWLVISWGSSGTGVLLAVVAAMGLGALAVWWNALWSEGHVR